MGNNLDKDIEILKKERDEMVTIRSYFKHECEDSQKCDKIIQAYENVLSEFETLREISGGLVIDNANLKIDLETWKKIAEKLADKMIYLPINEDGIFYCTKEAVIDWAKNEVEK